MRRLVRHLFALCSAVSLLLCVVVCVLWVRGHWTSGPVLAADVPGGMTVDVDLGQDAMLWVRWTRTSPPRAFGMATDYSVRLPGYQHRGGRTAHGPWFQCLAWAGIAAVFAVLPGLWVLCSVSRNRRDRMRPGGFAVARDGVQPDSIPVSFQIREAPRALPTPSSQGER